VLVVVGYIAGACSGARTAYPSEHLSAPQAFSGVRVARSFVFDVVFCRLVVWPIVLFLLAIILSVLPLTDTDYIFVIFKLFLLTSTA
jgi:hypothetical protein